MADNNFTTLVTPIIELKSQLAQYEVLSIKYISVNLCLACQSNIIRNMFGESDRKDGHRLKTVLGLTVHTVNTSKECLICH